MDLEIAMTSRQSNTATLRNTHTDWPMPQASLGCGLTGRLEFKGDLGGAEGQEMFSENKNIILKQIKIRRVYDYKRDALIYVAYSTRLPVCPTFIISNKPALGGSSVHP